MQFSGLVGIQSRGATLLFCLFVSLGCCRNAEAAGQASGSGSVCGFGAAVRTEGHHRLALVVGVGEYKNPSILDLPGASRDGERFYELLTGEGGYGFPKQNVCLLLDQEATTERFKEAFQKALVDRAEADDVAVVYFAGHGSRVPDANRDEPDEWDETLMFHDARDGQVRDLVDDEFNSMLATLHGKTKNITVILDSCNSGSATRAPAANAFKARYQPPLEDTGDQSSVDSGDGGKSWVPEQTEGLVLFSAAADGTSALEGIDPLGRAGGVFTDALLEVLAPVGRDPLTYAQASRLIPPRVAARSYQVPFFHGDLGGFVFGNEKRTRPMSLEVLSVEPSLKLGGPPLPGMGVGAELRIYDGDATGAQTQDPSSAKATVIATSWTGTTGEALVAAQSEDLELQPGDLAVLVRPGDDYVKIKVRLRPAGESGGISSQRAASIRDAVDRNPETKALVDLTEGAGEFELSVGFDDRLVLRGPEDQIRKEYERSGEGLRVATNLWQHARQKALLQLRGEGGADFADQETLSVQLVPAAKQNKCADGEWIQAAPNQEQTVPLCHEWNVRVTSNASIPLLVGALLLSSDGTVLALPADNRKERLEPGQTVAFNHKNETFIGVPPLDIQDRVVVFGTQETNPVAWHLIADTAAKRSAGGAPKRTGLYGALDRYLRPGARGIKVSETQREDSAWTLSSVNLRVVANAGFCSQYPEDVQVPGCPKTGAPSSQPKSREYTIPRFDIRPYLPDDPESPLRRVLEKADWLAHYGGDDGVPYKQHDWTGATDQTNLEQGIDCSRAVWFSFTRAGVSYNEGDRYLSTASMVGENTKMTERFESCDGDPELRLGDVLVFRDSSRNVGHTVIVIDPAKRIGWGSHGWDGNVAEGLEKDSGVEYQLIKYKRDWDKWDRPTMRRVACWRHRAFAGQGSRRGDRPGIRALQDACDANRQCGRH